MKISFTMRVVLLVVVAAFFCGYLGIAYVGAENEYQQGKDQVSKTLATATKGSPLQTPSRTVQDVQRDIDRVQQEVRRLMQQYPERVEETRIMNKVLEIADAGPSSVLRMVNSEQAKKTDSYSYPVSTISLQVTGAYSALLDFLSALEADRTEEERADFPSVVVQRVSVTPHGQEYVAEVTFSVYSRPQALPKPAPAKYPTTSLPAKAPK